MPVTCQQTYFANQRCHYLTYADEPYCRWHKVIRDVRKRYEKTPGMSQINMYMAGACLFMVAVSFSKFGLNPHYIWGLAIAYLLPWACIAFADGMIIRDYPLSQFALWGKLLAFGLAISSITGLAFALALAADKEAGEILIRGMGIGQYKNLVKYGPPVLAILIALLSFVLTERLLGEVLLVENSSLGCIIGLAALGIVVVVLWPMLSGLVSDIDLGGSEAKESGGDEAKSTLLDYEWYELLAAYVVGWIAGVMVNNSMRQSRLGEWAYRRTQGMSMLSCALLPGLALYLTRYVLTELKAEGIFPLILMTGFAAALFCVAATQWIIGRAYS